MSTDLSSTRDIHMRTKSRKNLQVLKRDTDVSAARDISTQTISSTARLIVGKVERGRKFCPTYGTVGTRLRS